MYAPGNNTGTMWRQTALLRTRPHWSISSTRSDFTGTIAGNRRYEGVLDRHDRGTTTAVHTIPGINKHCRRAYEYRPSKPIIIDLIFRLSVKYSARERDPRLQLYYTMTIKRVFCSRWERCRTCCRILSCRARFCHISYRYRIPIWMGIQYQFGLYYE